MLIYHITGANLSDQIGVIVLFVIRWFGAEMRQPRCKKRKKKCRIQTLT